MGNYAATKTPCDTWKSTWKVLLSIPCVHQSLCSIYPVKNKAWWNTAKTKEAFGIWYTSFHIGQTCMTCMHLVKHSHIQYSVNKDIHIHVGGEDLLSVVVQEGLCAAAAVGLTSAQPTPGRQYHCYSSIHTSEEDSLHQLVNYEGENRNFVWIYFMSYTPAVYCSTKTKQNKKTTKCNGFWVTLVFLVNTEARMLNEVGWLTLRSSSPKNEDSVVIYSPPCRWKVR